MEDTVNQTEFISVRDVHLFQIKVMKHLLFQLSINPYNTFVFKLMLWPTT